MKAMKTWQKVGLVTFGVLFIAFLATGGMNSSDTETKASTANKSVEKKEETKKSISQSDAEQFCQDAALLDKYIDRDVVAIVDADNYNVNFTEDIGDGVASLQWNGKNKDTDESMLFVCDVSGTDELTLENLAINGEQVF